MPSALTFSERALRRVLLSLFSLPPAALSRMGGPPARNDRGEPLDGEVRLLCALNNRMENARTKRTVQQVRDALHGSIHIVEGAQRLLARTEDIVVEGMTVRVYVPHGQGPHPVIVYLHGGGWVIGDLHTHDRFCRRLAADGNQIVMAVDYPLAPEHPYPQGLRGAYAAFQRLRTMAASFGGDPERVAIGGDSAGGNLAASVCLMLRENREPQPTFQLLIYPGLDLRCLAVSYQKLGRGYILTQQSIQWYLQQYAADPSDPRASPLLEPDLSGLAKALIVTAGFDPLRDDGELYAERLRAAGVEVVHQAHPELIHGFINMDGVLAAADRAVGAMIEQLYTSWSARRDNLSVGG